MMTSSTKSLLLFSCVLVLTFIPSSSAQKKDVRIKVPMGPLPDYKNSIHKLNSPRIDLATAVNHKNFDSVIVITDNLNNLEKKGLKKIKQEIEKIRRLNPSFGTLPSVTVFEIKKKSRRLIYAKVGGPFDEYSDVRGFSSQTAAAVRAALAAGSKRPLLVIAPSKNDGRYSAAILVSLLAAVQENYLPLSHRMDGSVGNITKLGLFKTKDDKFDAKTIRDVVKAFEAGRMMARDICGADPETMAPPKVWSYVQWVQGFSSVQKSVIYSQSVLEKEMPLIAAVNRATVTVPRHQARFITLNYTSRGKVDTTLFFVGKGVTYDTGGTDLKKYDKEANIFKMKTNSRHKCGAATVAGIIKTFQMLKPRGVKAVGIMPMVRNSVGAEAYVPDELIKGRSGKTFRIGSTDTDGLLTLSDALAYTKELALNAPNPTIICIGTMTPHTQNNFGPNYSSLVVNGPAKKVNMATKLDRIGELVGDPFGTSSFTKFDFEEYFKEEDLEAKTPVTCSARGHLYPPAFLLKASGLDQHSIGAPKEIPVVYIDTIGPHVSSFPGTPSTTPLVPLTSHFALNSKQKNTLGVAIDEE